MIRILIPLDGSNASEQSLHHALAIAKTFPAELVLLRVIAEGSSNPAAPADCLDFALWRHQAKAYLRNLKKKHATAGVAVTCEVMEGNPAEVILQGVTRYQPDLLILARYGDGNASGFSIGGTAQKVLSSADCSVVVVDPRQPECADGRYHRIVAMIDDSKESECALAIATMLAEIHGAMLLLVQPVAEPRLPPSFPDSAQAQQLVREMKRIVQNEAQRRLHKLVTRLPVNLDVETRVLMCTDPALAIEWTAEEFGSDLVLLHDGHSNNGSGFRISAVNQSLIQYSHKPLFIFRSTAADGSASNFRSVYLEEEPRREAG